MLHWILRKVRSSRAFTAKRSRQMLGGEMDGLGGPCRNYSGIRVFTSGDSGLLGLEAQGAPHRRDGPLSEFPTG
jgi:hypothetical protein